MTFNELKYRALVGIFDIAGQFISSQLTKPSYEGQEKLASEYFEELKLMARKEEQRVEKERKQIGYKEPEPELEPPVTDITTDKIERGTACLACLPPDELVFTNPDMKPISDIEVGDKVLDRYGEYTDVLEVMQRQYTGEMISILPIYQAKQGIITTPEHPILVLESQMCNKVRGYCVPGKNNVKCKECKLKNQKTELKFIPAGKLYTSKRNPHINDKKLFLIIPRITSISDIDSIFIDELIGDSIVDNAYILTHKNCKKIRNEVKINEDFMKLAGYYLAEGSIAHESVRFHFGSHEKEYITETKKLIKKIFSITPKIEERKSTTTVIMYSVVLSKLFVSLFNEGSANKKLPIWFFSLPHIKQIALLKTYLNGDGSISKKRINFSYSTVSKQLAFSIRSILFRLGILTGLGIYENNNKSFIHSKHPLYQIRITGQSAKKMDVLFKMNLFEGTCRAHEGGIDKDNIYIPIKEINKFHYDGLVMNLRTKSNTYSAKGIIVHNCSRDHFSTASAALSEALRFARKEGIGCQEVQRRFGMALDELNICERLDLAPENIVNLSGREKTIAEDALNSSRQLRHDITAIRSPSDLEHVSAEAANIRTKFMKNMWAIATLDGSAEKLCKGLEDEERERCISVIHTVLEKKSPLETVDEIGS